MTDPSSIRRASFHSKTKANDTSHQGFSSCMGNFSQGKNMSPNQ